jgi:hypothetical protein
VAVLVSADKVEFRFVRDTVEISDSALSQHMTTLEQDGYLKVTKGQVGRRPRTCCQPRRLDDQPSPATSPPSTRSHTQRHQVVDWNWKRCDQEARSDRYTRIGDLQEGLFGWNVTRVLV